MISRPREPGAAAGSSGVVPSGQVSPAFPASDSLGVPVLMYHSIGTGCARRFSKFQTSNDAFAAQLDYLDARGYRTMTAAQLADHAAQLRLQPKTVVLTFDDAFADFAEVALPMLTKHRFAATLFVPAGYVGGTARWLADCGEADRPMLSWNALREITGQGIEVAAHSHWHPQLDRIPDADVADEVSRSKALLEDELGLPVRGFAYPFGYWNRAARGAVANAGYGYGCAVAEVPFTARDDPLTIPRLTAAGGLDAATFARLVQRRPPTAGLRWTAAGKRIAWRAARQAIPALGGNAREGSPDFTEPPGVA
jgi:peptidoglycan/xylan/chitin deacetylase (PgdA/CDA1 family)